SAIVELPLVDCQGTRVISSESPRARAYPRRGGRLPCCTSSPKGLRLLLLLDEIAPCLRNPFQGLHDIVWGNALCSEIHHHTFCIVSPKDPINKIITTSLRDMDRAHGAVLPSSHGVNIFDHFWFL